jgi:hypothetical protein
MLKNAPGARSEMNTKELIKNWQSQKAKDNEYQDELRKRAQEQAKPVVERILVDKYTQEEINRATTDKGTQFKEKLKDGLGINIDKATSQESMDRMIGRTGKVNADGQVEHTDIFDRDKLKGYAEHGDINQNRIKGAAGNINFSQGARQGIRTNMTFGGVERAIRRDGERVEYIDPKTDRKTSMRFKRPPQRP